MYKIVLRRFRTFCQLVVHQRYRKILIAFILTAVLLFIWQSSEDKSSEYDSKNLENLSNEALREEVEDDDKVDSNWDTLRRRKFARLELKELQQKLTNVPETYFLDTDNRTYYGKECAAYPRFTDLIFMAQHWQMLITINGLGNLLSAFYDDRPATGPVIRVVAMINRQQFNVQLVCQLWIKDHETPVIATEVSYIVPHIGDTPVVRPGLYVSHVITCKIPEEARELVPVSVSIVKRECELATNNLKVFNQRPANGVKKKFGICVRATNFYHLNNAVNFVEWMEMLGILEVDMVSMYVYRANDAFHKTLDHYQRAGRLEVHPITVPGQLVPFPSFIYDTELHMQGFMLETAAFHDCFYRNLYKYEFITPMDIDEVIVPVGTRTWPEMLQVIDEIKDPKQNYSYYKARQTRFFDNWNQDQQVVVDAKIPAYTPMLGHVTRNQFLDTMDAPKGLMDTRFAVIINNHWTIECLDRCSTFAIPINVSQLSHYRAKYYEGLEGPFVQDTLLWKYKDELTQRTADTLKAIGIYPGDKKP